jgi:hypothetical protein
MNQSQSNTGRHFKIVVHPSVGVRKKKKDRLGGSGWFLPQKSRTSFEKDKRMQCPTAIDARCAFSVIDLPFRSAIVY